VPRFRRACGASSRASVQRCFRRHTVVLGVFLARRSFQPHLFFSVFAHARVSPPSGQPLVLCVECCCCTQRAAVGGVAVNLFEVAAAALLALVVDVAMPERTLKGWPAKPLPLPVALQLGFGRWRRRSCRATASTLPAAASKYAYLCRLDHPGLGSRQCLRVQLRHVRDQPGLQVRGRAKHMAGAAARAAWQEAPSNGGAQRLHAPGQRRGCVT